MGERLADQALRHARPGGLEDAFARLLPEVEIHVDGEQLAWLAARALQPKEEPAVSLAHLHAPAVSVREQADIIVGRLRRAGTATFRALVADAGERLVVVARFLALLELARERAVTFDQLAPLGELTVRWTGSAEGELAISAEFDEGPERETPAGSDHVEETHA
jgi:segregation and condensation protein A